MDNEYPSRGELVIANVERVVGYGAFVRLEEYGNKQGIVSISEFSQKWVKNPRSYLREGQKAVLKVLGVKRDRGHIDLSLKKVNDNERRIKLKEYKLEIRIRKLLEHFAEQHKLELKELYGIFGDRLAEDYGSIYEAFAQVANGNEDLASYMEDAKLRTGLVKMIQENIKPTLVSIKGFVTLSSESGDGVQLVREALLKGGAAFPEGVEGAIGYITPPTYRIDVTADDYKAAERAMKNCYEAIEEYAQSKGMEFAFNRELKKKAS